jgi:magnesium transporter
VEEMESDHRADLLAEMDEGQAEAILLEMDQEEAQDARRLMEYDEDTAGGLMATEFVQYPQDMKAGDLIADLRDHASSYFDRGIQYIYVQSDSGTLVGVIRMRDLLFSSWEAPLSRIMIVNPVSVFVDTSLEDLDDHFAKVPFWSLPVVDHKGRMLGVVRRSDMEEALGEQSERALLRFSGIIGGEEIRSMPVRERATRRLYWLVFNTVLTLIAASVVLLFENTVEEVFLLVFFMPVVSNLCGCSGNQAVAVSIRELAVGLIQPQDFMLVWKKELGVGVINGLAIGVILGLVAYVLSVTLWESSLLMGPVIGLAFFFNTVVAVSLGGLIPLLLKQLGADAALGAPPILTTLTDMCGFLLVLSLATAALSMGWI